MSFHFQREESPEKALRRVCRKRLLKTLGRLRKMPQSAEVHAARRELKRVRAVLRLLRGALPHGDYRKGAKALRRAAARLSDSRDSQVLLDTFETLAREPDRFPKLRKRLKKNCRREARCLADDDSASSARGELRRLIRHVSTLKIPAPGWEAIRPGLDQTYRQGRKDWALARTEPSPEHLHAWRRRVKHLMNQLEWLCPRWPAGVLKFAGQLELLAEWLGDEHDRYLLTEFLGNSGKEASGEAASLNRILEADRKRLRARSLKLGALLYRESPSSFAARIGRHWQAWHG